MKKPRIVHVMARAPENVMLMMLDTACGTKSVRTFRARDIEEFIGVLKDKGNPNGYAICSRCIRTKIYKTMISAGLPDAE